MSHVIQLVKNTISGWAAKIIQIPIALLVIPFLAKKLGPEGFGLIGLFSVFAVMGTVADLGLRSALGRELAEKVAQKDEQGFRELSSTALLLYLAISSVLMAVIWIGTPWLLAVFKVGDAWRKDAEFLFQLFGCLSTLFSFVSPVFSSGLASFMRFDLDNYIQAAVLLVTNALFFIFASMWTGKVLHVWVYATLLGSFSTVLFLYVFYRRICFGGELGWSLLRAQRVGGLFSLGWKMYVVQMSATISDRSDPLVISFFTGPTGVALYQPAARVLQALNPLVMTLTSQLYPLTTSYHANQEGERMKDVLCEGTKYTLLLGVVATASVFSFAEPFARLWLFDALGGNYIVVANMMKLFAVVELFSYASGTQWPILLGMKNLSFINVLLFVTAVLNISISVYLVGYSAFGVYGVLVGTLVSKAVRVAFLAAFITKLLKVRLMTFMARALLRPLVCLALAGLAGTGLVQYFACQTWTEFIVAAIIMVFVCFVILLSFGLSRREVLFFYRGLLGRGKSNFGVVH